MLGCEVQRLVCLAVVPLRSNMFMNLCWIICMFDQLCLADVVIAIDHVYSEILVNILHHQVRKQKHVTALPLPA